MGLPNHGRITSDKRPCTANAVLQLIILGPESVVQLKTSVSYLRNLHFPTQSREGVVGLLVHYRTFQAYGGCKGIIKEPLNTQRDHEMQGLLHVVFHDVLKAGANEGQCSEKESC